MDILQKVHLVHTVLVFFGLDISKDNESAYFLSYIGGIPLLTFFIGCQEVSPSLKDFYKILRLSLFGDGEVANISLSLDEAKTMKFLEDAVKKTLKKPVLKARRKWKTPSEEVLEDTSIGNDKGFRANFWGWIRYFWKEYVDAWIEKPIQIL